MFFFFLAHFVVFFFFLSIICFSFLGGLFVVYLVDGIRVRYICRVWCELIMYLNIYAKFENAKDYRMYTT